MSELVLLPLHAPENHQAFRGANTPKLNVPWEVANDKNQLMHSILAIIPSR